MEEYEGLLGKILRSFSRQEGLDDLLKMSEHRDGYKRENAVRRLGMLGNPIAIPQLLIRVNDWVPQVRSAAMESLLKLLKNENAHAFIYSLPTLYHLENCGRSDHNQLIASVINWLLKPENVSHIKAAIKNEDPYIARIAVKLCIENDLLDQLSFISTCISHSDVIIRKIASRLLFDLPKESLELLLPKAIQDPFMPIRREAFKIYIKVFPEQSMEIAFRLLFDKHNAIREIAITELLKNNTDVELIFTDILSSSSQRVLKVRFAILGLAYLNSKKSISIVEKYVNNSLPRVKTASLQALAKLLGENVRPYLLVGLKDKSPHVTKVSSSLLKKLRLQTSIDELLTIINSTDYPHTLTVCLTNARIMNKWDHLILILSLWKETKECNYSDFIDAELMKWDANFNRTSSQPTNSQKTQIWEQYHKCLSLLDKKRRGLLEFTVKEFKINP